MKRHIIALLATIATFSVCFAAASDDIIMEARSSAMQFSSIRIAKRIRLIVENRTDGNIVIRTSRRAMPHVALSVKDGVFLADVENSQELSRNDIIEVYIPNNKRLTSIKASQAASVTIHPQLAIDGELAIDASSASSILLSANAARVAINASGASRVELTTVCDSLRGDISSASALTLSGKCAQSNLKIGGASLLRASDFEADQLDLQVNSASSATAKARSCNIEANGTSKAKIECSEHLPASASSASSITYSGNCQLILESASGASSIKKQE